MIVEDFLVSLDLPDSTLVSERIAKKVLVENGVAMPAEKRVINAGCTKYRE